MFLIMRIDLTMKDNFIGIIFKGWTLNFFKGFSISFFQGVDAKNFKLIFL